MRFLAFAGCLLLAASAVACSEDEPSGSEPAADGGSGGDGGGGGATSKYPSGPYGTKERDVLPDFAFEGLVNERGAGLTKDAEWVSDYSVGALIDTGARYALIHLSVIGDAGSEAAAATLVEEGLVHHDKGAQIVEVLSRDDGTPASQEELEQWVTTHAMSVTAVVNSPDAPLTVYDALGGVPESAFIIKLPTGNIEWVAEGVPQFTTVENGIHWLESLLAE